MKATLLFVRRQISQLPGKQMSPSKQAFAQRYLGTQKKYLGIKTGDLVKIAKEILRRNPSLTSLTTLISRLLTGSTFEEHVIGGKIFTFLKPKVRAQIPLEVIEKWLKKARGWAEVDVVCQSAYTGREVMDRWPEWQKTIRRLAGSKDVSLRRASLVLMTKPVREIADPRLRALAFETVEKLKHEKDILITKAVSWLLRSLTFQNKAEVRRYLLTNEASLPRIAFRETLKKIETGKK